jgi:hypothetical protein
LISFALLLAFLVGKTLSCGLLTFSFSSFPSARLFSSLTYFEQHKNKVFLDDKAGADFGNIIKRAVLRETLRKRPLGSLSSHNYDPH